VGLQNFTDFEKLPSREWDSDEAAWEAMVYEDLEW
jgi:hypothetical protein